MPEANQPNEKRLLHLEAEVGALSQVAARTETAVEALAHQVARIADQQNKPADTKGLILVGLGIVAMMGTIAFAFITPQTKSIEDLQKASLDQQLNRERLEFERGKTFQLGVDTAARVSHMDERDHVLEDKVDLLEIKTATHDAYFRAISERDKTLALKQAVAK